MASSKKKTSPKTTIVGIALLLAILIAALILCLSGCGRNKNKPCDADKVQSLADYAEQLEAAGNSEAAAAVRELIAKYGGGDLIPDAIEDIPVAKSDSELRQFRDFLSGEKGAEEK